MPIARLREGLSEAELFRISVSLSVFRVVRVGNERAASRKGRA